MKVILSSGSLFNFDVETVIALAAETGFDGLELMVDWRRETHTPDHLRRLTERYRLPILAVHSPFVEMWTPAWPDDPIESIKASVALAETLGATLVVVHPPGRWLRLQGQITAPGWSRKLSLPLPLVGPGRLGHWLQHKLPAFQAETAVKIAVENMPCRRLGPLTLEPHHFFQPQVLARFKYVTLDTTHVGTRGLDLLAFYRHLKHRVAHVHLSNFNGQQHQLPTNGHLPLAELLQTLLVDEYSGLVSLELSPSSLQAESESRLRQNLERSLAFCHQAMRLL